MLSGKGIHTPLDGFSRSPKLKGAISFVGRMERRNLARPTGEIFVFALDSAQRSAFNVLAAAEDLKVLESRPTLRWEVEVR